METGPVPSAPAAGRADAGATQPSSGPRIVVERPPPGLARGKYGWPAWAIAAVGTAVVLLSVAFLAWRRRRRVSDRRAPR